MVEWKEYCVIEKTREPARKPFATRNVSRVPLSCFISDSIRRGTLGFLVFVPKDFGFSVLVFIAVCGSFFFQHLVFGFRRSYLRFFGFVMRCGFWVFLFCPISGFRFYPNFYAVLRFWVIFSSVLRFLIYPNAPLNKRFSTLPAAKVAVKSFNP